jgi:hypothetical protein
MASVFAATRAIAFANLEVGAPLAVIGDARSA